MVVAAVVVSVVLVFVVAIFAENVVAVVVVVAVIATEVYVKFVASSQSCSSLSRKLGKPSSVLLLNVVSACP